MVCKDLRRRTDEAVLIIHETYYRNPSPTMIRFEQIEMGVVILFGPEVTLTLAEVSEHFMVVCGKFPLQSILVAAVGSAARILEMKGPK